MQEQESKSSKGEGEGEHRHNDERFFYHSVSSGSVFSAEFSMRSKRGGGGRLSLSGGISIVYPFSTPTAYWCRSAITTCTSSVLSFLDLAIVFMRRPKLKFYTTDSFRVIYYYV